MPLDSLELQAIEEKFLEQHKAYVNSATGMKHQARVQAFAQVLRGGKPAALGKAHGREAAAFVQWVMRIPADLRPTDAAPFLQVKDFGRITPLMHAAVGQGVELLTMAGHALLVGGATRKDDWKPLPASVLRFAFGADRVSAALREVFADPKAPPWPKLPGLDTKTLDRWVREGALREVLATLARCGFQAAQVRDQQGLIRAIGRVDKIDPDRACAGQLVTLHYSGLGTLVPAAGSDVAISVPTESGCAHYFLSQLTGGGVLTTRWHDAGQVAVTLPANVTSGKVGMFLVPPPLGSSGCEVGSLATAVGLWRETLQPAGAASASWLEQWVGRVEGARLGGLPCAGAGAQLRAGRPRVGLFRVVEGTGPIYPRNTVTVEWSVSNAEAVAIYARSNPGSENTHQLPIVPFPVAMQGRVTLQVPCTSRWEADLVLEASNTFGCSGPVGQRITLHSGYSDWIVGVGKADITDRTPGRMMAGFAYKRQESHGDVFADQGREYPLFARAFYIRENRATGAQEQLLICCDIWTATIALKQELLRRLNAGRATPRFTDANVLLAGTHTHAAPGGYSHYPLYNLTIGGFDEGVFNTLATGIEAAARSAMATARPGHVHVATGKLDGCGANRSFEAYQQNPEYQAGATQEDWTDREMLLLAFSADVDNRGGRRPLGVLNWYAIHPTSLGMFNRLISGDSKGWAAAKFEDEMAATAPGFVAAFANGSAGDVSGNVTLDAQGNKTYRRPIGGELPAGTVAIFPVIQSASDTQTDIDNMKRLGDLQCQHALGLYRGIGTAYELTGRLDAQHAWIDMSDFPIAALPGARTWPAALGVSFGSGSSEDSIAYASMGFLDIDAGIPEGMHKTNFVLGGVAFWAAMASAALSSPAAVASVVAMVVLPGPLSPSQVVTNLSLIATLVIPGARAYAASFVAWLGLPGELPRPTSSTGSWEWKVPGPMGIGSDVIDGHGDKPIMFTLGQAELAFTPNGAPAPDPAIACPLVPQVLPMQVVRIGTAVIAAVPAEFTSTAGQRMKTMLRQTLGPRLTHVAVSNYSNGYSSYVATPEEYTAQHYEGASTLYGPHTLAAYLEVYGQLALGVRPVRALTVPFTVPAVAMR